MNPHRFLPSACGLAPSKAACSWDEETISGISGHGLPRGKSRESHGEGERGLHSPKTPRSERGKSQGTQLRAAAHQPTA